MNLKNSSFDIIDDEHGDDLPQNEAADAWKVLVVDDDEDIHLATRFALKNIEILQHPLQLIHCHSSADALKRLEHESDIAAAIIDVVMESSDAGLLLINQIRTMARLQETRIILRTGQPGYAPELSVITEYDINAYVTKSELTKSKLVSVLITAIRSYQQLHIINQGRRGLELIVGSTIDLFKRTNINMLAQGILTQLLGLMGNSAKGLVARSKVMDVSSGFSASGRISNLNDYCVLTASESYSTWIGQSLADVKAPQLAETFTRARKSDMGLYTGKQLGLHFHTRQNLHLFIYIDIWREPYPDFITLIKLFSSNIAVVFENLMLIEELDQLAFYDSLLPIHNRNAFQTEYHTLLRDQQSFSFLRVRINSLDRHISAFGPNITDSALIRIKEKLENELETKPFFVGFDGKSDFLILVPNGFNPTEINQLFHHSISVENVHLQISVTIGVVNPEPEMTPQTVLRNSIATLLEKHNTISESNVLVYNPSMSKNVLERLSLQSSLYQAVLQEKEIQIYLQPKISIKTKSIVGAEVLCRWIHNGNFIPPDKFIPIAEESGLISRLTSLVIKLTGRFFAARARQGLKTPTCAVNLSMFDLQLPNAADKLHAEIAQAGLDSSQIDLEITESAMMRDTFHVINQVQKLKSYGYKIAIDDFGTGYSSLSYLENLPIDYLKVDKKLIQSLNPNNARNSIVAIAVLIAQTIGLKIISEGVETLEQEAALSLLGCDICQGYLYHKPLPVTEFNALLSSVETSGQQN